jgi:hypothetical protein
MQIEHSAAACVLQRRPETKEDLEITLHSLPREFKQGCHIVQKQDIFKTYKTTKTDVLFQFVSCSFGSSNVGRVDENTSTIYAKLCKLREGACN